MNIIMNNIQSLVIIILVLLLVDCINAQVALIDSSINQNEGSQKFISNARKYIGVEYKWGGRLTSKNPGLDCLGLVFLAFAKTYKTNWTKLSVYPSILISENQLGEPVSGLDGVLCRNVDINKMATGDIIFLLSRLRIPDEPLVTIDSIKFWVWHVGIVSDISERLFLEAYPGRHVLQRCLDEVLNENEAIFVVRINQN
jgi:hypothetical protein